MSTKLAEIVDEIKSLDMETKEYLNDLIKKLLIEERRKEIKKNAEASIKEYKRGKVEFGCVKDMKASLKSNRKTRKTKS